jgi:hypothetical protein
VLWNPRDYDDPRDPQLDAAIQAIARQAATAPELAEAASVQ